MNLSSLYLPEVRTKNIVVSDQKDEILLYCLETHRAYNLNKTVAAVYQTADGTKSISEIANLVSKQLNSPVTEDLVLFSLIELDNKSLLKNSGENELNAIGVSRREIIKKAALSTAAALPVITMLVAPKAAAAQSTCGTNGVSCTGGNPEVIPFFQGSCWSGFVCCPDSRCRLGGCPL